MATTHAEAPNDHSWRSAQPQPAACEACRKQKMRCTRSLEAQVPGEPCDRCSRNNRTCRIPERRPQGRRRGAVGRYTGVEKAVRQIQAQVRKASRGSKRNSHDNGAIEADIFEILATLQQGSPDQQITLRRGSVETVDTLASTSPSGQNNGRVEPLDQNSPAISPHRADESVSNPLGLLADASSEAQAIEDPNSQVDPALTTAVSFNDIPPLEGAQAFQHLSQPVDFQAQSMLRRPGYVSLGLKLDRSILESALENLFTRPGRIERYANYFKTGNQKHAPDTGPDVDPVDLGLVSMEEVWYLFPLFFERLHPVNGILDPMLHTPDFVRPRSALLFTWILAISAQFDHGSAALSRRLRLHGEKLSKHVHSHGYKSVEIAQGYYISLLAAVPASTLAEDHSSIYTNYALGMTSDLGLDRHTDPGDSQSCCVDPSRSCCINATEADGDGWASTNPCETRLIRNKERTWYRIILWERAHSAACGKMTPFPDNELTRRVHDWWKHPLADPTDKYTSAFMILRQHLSKLFYQIKGIFRRANNPRHWVRDLVDSTLDPWRRSWISDPGPQAPMADRMRNLFLRYVYMHGRLWTLSFALHDPSHEAHDATDTKEDCFEAAVNCCEVTIRDLREIGEAMYCLMVPSWAMSSYAAVLALKLFPQLYGDRPGQEVELLALLAEIALQLEQAGTTPRHRFGIAALLGQHLFLVLRRRLTALKDSPSATIIDPLAMVPLDDSAGYQMVSGDNGLPQQQPADLPVYLTDPFYFNGLSPRGASAAQEAFADMMREWGGPPFDALL